MPASAAEYAVSIATVVIADVRIPASPLDAISLNAPCASANWKEFFNAVKATFSKSRWKSFTVSYDPPIALPKTEASASDVAVAYDNHCSIICSLSSFCVSRFFLKLAAIISLTESALCVISSPIASNCFCESDTAAPIAALRAA